MQVMHPEPRQQVRKQANAFPAIPTCLHAGQHDPSHTSMSAHRPTCPCVSKCILGHANTSQVGKCIPSYASTSACKQISPSPCQHVHKWAITSASAIHHKYFSYVS